MPEKEEKVFTIPLRKAYEAQRTRRAKKAISIVRQFLSKHMKSEDVKLGASINKAVWARGIQKPPRKVKIHATKNEQGTVFAEMVGVELKTPSKEELKKKAEKLAEKKRKLKEERKERKEKPPEEEAKKERPERRKIKEEKTSTDEQRA